MCVILLHCCVLYTTKMEYRFNLNMCVITHRQLIQATENA